MATFALFYKPQDIIAIGTWATNVNLTTTEKQYALKLWNAGLKNWQSAPQAEQVIGIGCVSVPFEPIPGQIDPDKTWSQLPDGRWLVCDPTMKCCVVSGAQVSKQLTIDWLRLIGNKYPDAAYMLAIADDIEQTAVEPYNG